MTIAAAISLCAALSAAGDPELPRVWTYDPPVGETATSGLLTPLVRVPAWAYLSPTSVADETCDFIKARNLGEGEVGILLFAFGRGSIFGHPGDALQSPPAPAGLSAAPWTLHGRQAARTWTQQFIARYQQRAAAEQLPSPTRWHMDCEYRLPALCYQPDIAACWGTQPVQYFAAVQQDPRWSSEPLLMNPGGTPAQRTLSQLYAAAGSPSFDPTQPRGAPANRVWSSWWDSVTREAMEGALKDGFYDLVQAAWPGSLTSEFASSMRLDGGIEPDGTARQFVDFEWWDNGWMRSRWDGHGDLQAPTLYLFGESFIEPSGDFWEQNLGLHRGNLDACLHSYGGAPPSSITPWVCLPDFALPDGNGPFGSRAISRDEFVSMVALLRSRGISEFMLFPGAGEPLWNFVGLTIRSIWSTELQSAAVLHGSSMGDAAELARRAERQSLAIAPAKGHASVRARFSAPPRGAGAPDGRFWLSFELSAPSGGTAEVFVLDASGAASPLASFELRPSLPGARWLGPFNAAGLVRPDGTLEVRLDATVDGSEIHIDLMQAVVERGQSPDIDGDGVVGASDLARILGAWDSERAGPDLDRDGVVGPNDLAILLNAWG